MKKLTPIILFALMTLLAVLPFQTISQTSPPDPQRDSFTLDIIESSPSNFEVNNGTALFSGSINSATPGGKNLKEKHSLLAKETVDLIDQLSTNYYTTKEINKRYFSLTSDHLSIWKSFTNKHTQYNNILNREIQLFNVSLDYQLQENSRWAVIDSTIKEIEELNDKNSTPVWNSLPKSSLYTDLLLAYIDLNDFYKVKYKEVLTLSLLSHAAQENPNLNLPSKILEEIRPLHRQEKQTAKTLIYNLQNNIDDIKIIGTKAKELDAFYNEVNKYSINEIDKILQSLKSQTHQLEAQQSNFLAHNEIIPISKEYIKYYESLKHQLENQVLAYEIEQATLAGYYEAELTRVAYTGFLYPGMEYAGLGDWASSAWNGLKTTTKVVTGTGFAITDYATGKASEKFCEYTDKASAAWDKGLFSKEYSDWSQAYDKAGENQPVTTIKNTFVNPLVATLKGDDKNGLGQAAVNKAQGSFTKFDKYVADKTGSNFISQVALNTVTCGGYGLAKDLTTVNDANASTGQKIVASAGIILAVAPALSGAKAANEGTKGTLKSLATSTANKTDEIAAALRNSNAASSTLKNATQNLRNATGEMVEAAGKNFQNADVLNSSFNAVAQNFDDAVIKRVGAQVSYSQAQRHLSSTIKGAITQVPKDTIKGGAKSAFSGFVADHTVDAIKSRFADLYTNSLTQVIKGSEPFIGKSIGQSIGLRDLTNFTIGNFVNNTLTGGITTTLDGILNSNNQTQQNTPSPQGNNNQPQQNTQPAQGNNNSQPQQNTQPAQGNNNNPSQQNLPTAQDNQNTIPIVDTNQQLQNNPNTVNNVVPMAPGIGNQQAGGYYPANPIGPPAYYDPQQPGYQQPYPGYPQGTPQNYQQPGYYTGANPPGYQQPGIPGYTDPNLLSQYLGSQNNTGQNSQPSKPNTSDIDNVIGQVQQNQQNWSQNAGQQNSVSYNPNQNQQQFDTGFGGQSGNISQHVQGLSQQTAQMQPTHQPHPQPTQPPQPNNPTSNLGNGIPEQNTTNGIDDDNDDVIDEGPVSSSCQIVIYDDGGIKDDQWQLSVDGQNYGVNTAGKSRFWNLNLSRGQHRVTATGVLAPDNNGTFKLWFNRCSKVSGDALKMNNFNPGMTKSWVIQVP